MNSLLRKEQIDQGILSNTEIRIWQERLDLLFLSHMFTQAAVKELRLADGIREVNGIAAIGHYLD